MNEVQRVGGDAAVYSVSIWLVIPVLLVLLVGGWKLVKVLLMALKG